MDENKYKLLQLALEDSDRLLESVLTLGKIDADLREALQARRNMNAEIFAHLGNAS